VLSTLVIPCHSISGFCESHINVLFDISWLMMSHQKWSDNSHFILEHWLSFIRSAVNVIRWRRSSFVVQIGTLNLNSVLFYYVCLHRPSYASPLGSCVVCTNITRIFFPFCRFSANGYGFQHFPALHHFRSTTPVCYSAWHHSHYGVRVAVYYPISRYF